MGGLASRRVRVPMGGPAGACWLEQMDTGRHGGPPARTSGSAPRWCQAHWTPTLAAWDSQAYTIRNKRPMLHGAQLWEEHIAFWASPHPRCTCTVPAPLLGTHLRQKKLPR